MGDYFECSSTEIAEIDKKEDLQCNSKHLLFVFKHTGSVQMANKYAVFNIVE